MFKVNNAKASVMFAILASALLLTSLFSYPTQAAATAHNATYSITANIIVTDPCAIPTTTYYIYVLLESGNAGKNTFITDGHVNNCNGGSITFSGLKGNHPGDDYGVFVLQSLYDPNNIDTNSQKADGAALPPSATLNYTFTQ